MKKEKEAIYIKDRKIGYRVERPDGSRGVAYIKGDKQVFVSNEELIADICQGPRKKIG